jgi:hypothetical protein
VTNLLGVVSICLSGQSRANLHATAERPCWNLVLSSASRLVERLPTKVAMAGSFLVLLICAAGTGVMEKARKWPIRGELKARQLASWMVLVVL